MQPTATQPPPKKKLSLSFDIKTVLIVLLLVTVGAMLFLWKPWQPNIKANERTVTVTGDATLTAEPDEFIFTPSYDFENADKQTALTQMSQASTGTIAKLKALGVPDKDIQSNSSGYSSGIYYPVYNTDGTTTYTLTLTLTLNDRTLAQKVQDYLVTTSPTGEVSPQAELSDTKTKTLQSQARDQASKDARSKADQSAKNLGFKVAAVKSVTDGSGFQNPIPVCAGGLCAGTNELDSGTPSLSLGVQPGQNKLQYSVTVVYYIR